VSSVRESHTCAWRNIFSFGAPSQGLSLLLAMASPACVAASITHLVTTEVVEGLISALRMWTSVAAMWVEAVINLAPEAVGAVEPRAGSEEHAAVEPLGSVVPIWSAVVRSNVVIAIRANRLSSDID
jgi:hypothetical protein